MPRIPIAILACVALGACALTTAPTRATANPAMPALDAAAVVGKHWVADESRAADPKENPRLEFLRDGRLAGYSGCNVVSGTWRIEGGALRLGPLAMTKRGCMGPAGEVEKRFIAAVGDRSEWALAAGRLVAQGAGGARMEFAERASAP
jgi:heat shock protein HslJ